MQQHGKAISAYQKALALDSANAVSRNAMHHCSGELHTAARFAHQIITDVSGSPRRVSVLFGGSEFEP
jgi:hypothetical protein